MDRIGRLRDAIFGTNEKKENPSEKPAENPLNSHKTKSSAHVNTELDQHVRVNVKTSDTAIAKPAPASPTATGIIGNGSAPTSTYPTSTYPTSTSSTNASSKTTASISTASSSKKTFTPAKPIDFSVDVQNKYYDILKPDAKSLAKAHGLTKKETAAIHAYTRNEYYRTMNSALRVVNSEGNVDTSSATALKSAGITDDGLAELIAATVSGMKKLPPDQTDPSVFFALGRNDSIPEEFLQPYAQGATITMGPFYSSTVSMPTVEEWWDNSDHFLSVLQTVNGNGRDISAFSEFPNEKEVLFMPGTRFMVLGRTEKTETPLGKPGLFGSSQTKTKILLQAQEISINPNDALPPTIHPSTFQSLAVPIKPKWPDNSAPTGSEKKSKSPAPTTAETKSTYFGMK